MRDPFKIDKIFLSAIEAGETESSELNTDVIVKMANGDKYVATFYTHDKITSVLNGQNDANSHYVWFKNLVLVETISRDYINVVVDEMIEEGDFQMIFEKLSIA